MKVLVKFFILLVLVINSISCESKLNQGNKPNIILILVDDMGFADLGCYGSEINTPNIDKLAEGGMRFTQFHNTSKCFPSRASLLTGLYAHQVGMDRNFGELNNSATLGEVLKTAGYRTLASGKHHGTENLFFRGFDRYYGLRDGAANHFNPGKQRDGEGHPAQKVRSGDGFRHWCVDDTTISPYTPPKDFYTTDYFTKYAIQFLDDYKAEENPFFLYLAYTAPHDPLMAWPEDIVKYEGKYNEGYEKIRKARYEKQIKLGLIDEKSYPLSDATYQNWDSLSVEEKAIESKRMEIYAAMIDRLDQNIGKLLLKLKELGKDDNTIIFFCSDNGASAEIVSEKGLKSGSKDNPLEKMGSLEYWASLEGNWANVSNTPFKLFKNNTHEGGICTPLIAYWQNEIKPNSFSDFPGHFIDFMPTIVELADAEYPELEKKIPEMEGTSLVDVLLGEESRRMKPIFWEWRYGKGIWKDGYKLVSDNKGGWELYKTEMNKTETVDLLQSQTTKYEELAKEWNKWKVRMEKYAE